MSSNRLLYKALGTSKSKYAVSSMDDRKCMCPPVSMATGSSSPAGGLVTGGRRAASVGRRGRQALGTMHVMKGSFGIVKSKAMSDCNLALTMSAPSHLLFSAFPVAQIQGHDWPLASIAGDMAGRLVGTMVS